MNMFKGFSYQVPIYTVITPQTGEKYDMRTLNVSEVEKLKHSITTSANATEVLNELMYEAITNKFDKINTYQKFLNNTTILDRSAIVYALYIITFDDTVDLNLSCYNPDCDNRSLEKINLTKIFRFEPYVGSNAVKKSYEMSKAINEESKDEELEKAIEEEDNKVNKPEDSVKIPKGVKFADDDEKQSNALKGKFKESRNGEADLLVTKNEEYNNNNNLADIPEIIKKKVDVKLPVTNCIVTIRQPTLNHQRMIFKDVPLTNKDEQDMIMETMLIEKFVITDIETGEETVINDRESIISAYKALPAKDKIIIFDKYTEEFGKYRIHLDTQWTCKKCGTINQIEIEISTQFFRMAARF